jgi:hypothetical protein
MVRRIWSKDWYDQLMNILCDLILPLSLTADWDAVKHAPTALGPS